MCGEGRELGRERALERRPRHAAVAVGGEHRKSVDRLGFAQHRGHQQVGGAEQDLGSVTAWRVEPPPLAGADAKPATLIVAEPIAYLRALMAGAGKVP